MSSSFISVSAPAKSRAPTGLRDWVFRGSVLVAGGLFLVSWLMPWWKSNIQEAGMYVQIRPWGLEHTLGSYVQYIGGDPGMPPFFAPLMWVYLVVALAALLASVVVKELNVRLVKFTLPLSQWLVLGVGISYIIFVVVCASYAYIRTAEFGIQLLGTSYIVIGDFELGTEAVSSFQPGYWLACAVGLLCVVLALLRNKIIGQPKLNA